MGGFGMGGQLGMGAGQLGFTGAFQGQFAGGFGGGSIGINGFNMNGRWNPNGIQQWQAQFGNVGPAGWMSYPVTNYVFVPPSTPMLDAYLLADKSILMEELGRQDRLRPTTARSLVPSLALRPVMQNTINWAMLHADLVAYAPGLETSPADILATLEREAKDLAGVKRGTIDASARKLIDAARQTGWRKRSIPGGSVTYDGAGRFVMSRELPTGLHETVVHDGETLRHLYAEIGLASIRPAGRAYRVEFEALLPGIVPPADDLARRADVVLRDGHTIAIVPHSKEATKRELRLIFNDAGHLVARRLIADDGKEAGVETFATPASAEAPNLTPDVSKLLVLPMPYRTTTWVEARGKLKSPSVESLKTDDTHLLLAAQFAACMHDGVHTAALQNFVRHWTTIAFWKLGIVTLVRAAGDHHSTIDPARTAAETNRPLVEHLRQAALWNERQQTGPTGDGLLARLHRLKDLWWQWGYNFNGVPSQRPAIWRETRDFVERNRHNHLGLAITVLAATERSFSQDDWRSAAELWSQFEADTEHGYAARYERVQCLLRGGLPNTGRTAFEDLIRDTLTAGQLPLLNEDVRNLPASEDGTTWETLLIRTAAQLAAQGRGDAALAIADQMQLLGGPPLARRAFVELAPHLATQSLPTRFAAAAFLARAGDHRQADIMLKTLMKEPEMAGDPVAWRLAADLAGQTGSIARKVECLDKALDLEFATLPEVVDVQLLRHDYDALLSGFADWLAACRAVDTTPPANIVARVIRSADRWRSIDPDPTLACQRASRVLRQLEKTDLAWDYLTTPLAVSANEAAPFQKLSQELQASGEQSLAEKALGAAFAAEPTNAQLLWDRAQILLEMGKAPAAQALLRQIVDGTWQPRFDGVKQQARAALGR